MTNTTPKKKLTKKDYFAILKSAYPTTAENYDEVIAFIDKEVALLEKKNGAERKPTKTQIENESYKKLILEHMTSKKVTVTDIQKNIEELNDFSNQKVARLVKDLYDAGMICKTVEKGRSYFFVAQRKGDKFPFPIKGGFICPKNKRQSTA